MSYIMLNKIIYVIGGLARQNSGMRVGLWVEVICPVSIPGELMFFGKKKPK